MKKVLNVGGNNKAIPLPPHFATFEHLLLDIDAKGNPDFVCDARELSSRLDAAQFDAVYCSHNLEHYYRHDVAKVLTGFLHVIKDNGFIQIRVPDIGAVMQQMVAKNLDIDDVLYLSKAGPIMALDVIYGYGLEIEQSGQDFFAHKTGFTQKSLFNALLNAGFVEVFIIAGDSLEINVLAFKSEPDLEAKLLFKLPD